ncbi:DUF2189 domain-containing protein [Rhodoferax sp.]|uniref:DUF2189 domain-containing protein n=1 Tax=Rhodoferax sp. TaxID=50421 RepID=UPI002841C1CB|nr:DUF2189 domain-containing protein [Rhodoferax sp.]MDR3371923.1 DUF2189 domain-containing protein [Rhodoferax sp.]
MPQSPLPIKPPLPRTISITHPLKWLGRGGRDMLRCGWISYLHGLTMTVFGGLLLVLAHEHFWLLAGAFSGFLLVAPILATSLYAMSRALERRAPVGWPLVLKTWLNWKDGDFVKWGDEHWNLVRFGIMLAAAGTAWVVLSAALIQLLATDPISAPSDFLLHVVLAPKGFLFELWLILGGVLVAPIFASTVITIPLLLDRQVSVAQAIALSWQVVLANPIAMAFWGAIIMGLILVGFSVMLLGLVIVVPLLGHASWHAYRDLVDVSSLPGWEQR